MIIQSSKILQKGNNNVVETTFETNGMEQVLWYEIPIEYKDYIVTDNQDASLIALLVLAMKNNEDIYVKGKISARLNYTLNTYLISALNLSNTSLKIIKIFPDSINYDDINVAKTAGTGLSCGIDSISTITYHKNLKKQFKIDYLTFFNAGSHGVFGGEIAKKIYDKRLLNIENCAKEIGAPLIKVNTNLLELLSVDFQSVHSIIHASCVLNLQKLFKTYYYASAFKFDYFKFDKKDTSSWDTLILNLLSTESTSFFSSMSQFSRYERTKLIADNSLSYKYLDVCTNPLNALKLNCSKCEKCLRTLVSLELIGKLNQYEDVFDLQQYFDNKDQYISELIINKDVSQINREIWDKLKQNKLIKLKHNLIATGLLLKRMVKNLF